MYPSRFELIRKSFRVTLARGAGTLALAACLVAVAGFASAQNATQSTAGWRGNWTGRWPDAQPPLEWSRVSHGPLENLRSAYSLDADGAADRAEEVKEGFSRTWLAIGPFPVQDCLAEFDAQQIANESTLQPRAGDTVGDLPWQPLSIKYVDPLDLGTAELPWVDLNAHMPFQLNQVGYVHTWLHCERAGRVRAVVDHSFGLKVLVNGVEVYNQPERAIGLGLFTSISRNELDLVNPRSPVFEFDVTSGWNRVLCKLSSGKTEGWTEMQFSLRLGELASVPYENRNIAWMTELPGRSTSTPIVVGDRLFVMSEPDELLCLDKATGKILWSAINDFDQATPASERAANRAFDAIQTWHDQLARELDFDRRLELRRQIRDALLTIDKQKYEVESDGHFASHFGIVGFTTPTPASDGQYVYVWCGNGVAACYDLEGNRRWITRIDAGHLAYPSSPALLGDRLGVYMNRLYALDTRSGEVVWKQPRVNKNNAAILPARIANTDVFVTQQGEIIRASDGKMLYRNPDKVANDSGWAAPVIDGDKMYLPWYGITMLNVMDFSESQGEEWTPKVVTAHDITINRRPNGGWLDRWMAGSPLYHEGLVYAVDIYATSYCIDPATQETLYRQQLDMAGLFHYNAVPVAASPALGGKYLYFVDNQGTTIVAEPGRGFKQVARNRIATQLERTWPLPPQETLSYGPPIFDGQRLYLRGERYLYCIGE